MIYKYSEFILEYKGQRHINSLAAENIDYDQRREEMVNTVQKTFQLVHKDKFLRSNRFDGKERKKYRRINKGYRRYVGYMKNQDSNLENQIGINNTIREMLEYDGPSWGHIAADKFFYDRKIVDEINSWEICCKSPWSHSYYDSTELDFGYKPDGSKRIADHWNFITKKSDNIECETWEGVPDDNKFRLGIFGNGKYRIIKKF